MPFITGKHGRNTHKLTRISITLIPQTENFTVGLGNQINNLFFTAFLTNSRIDYVKDLVIDGTKNYLTIRMIIFHQPSYFSIDQFFRFQQLIRPHL
ncbi:hypothetical protein DFR56_10899 [Pseudogracilibacillus auburnensis]|uniref:Uncharacterized protein n=1 Tax=Pseudogracilibacillus auburnensis TaxID=1494959 RepID=A0A2V3VZD2_9BACI|nr:hypothetical protein DFR56_10899 [Pseudogracilibacillus auburnensis]